MRERAHGSTSGTDGDGSSDFGDYVLTWEVGGGQSTPGFPGELIISELMPQPGGCDGGNGEDEVVNCEA